LAILQLNDCANREWLVPDFTCPVVPQLIANAGGLVQSYKWQTPWGADYESLKKKLSTAYGIVVPFYLGASPEEALWEILQAASIIVIEDRCQYVGLPPTASELRGDYAFGSFRKWMPTPDGGYGVSLLGPSPKPSQPPNTYSTQLRLAAGFAKNFRKSSLPPDADKAIEQACIELFRMGENELGIPDRPRYASETAEILIRNTDLESIAARRLANQACLATHLRHKKEVTLLEPYHGYFEHTDVPALFLPIICQDREKTRRWLASNDVYCAVHWIDGDWELKSDFAARMASTVLSVPIDQRYDETHMYYIADLLK
jgi:hypothetical protein